MSGSSIPSLFLPVLGVLALTCFDALVGLALDGLGLRFPSFVAAMLALFGLLAIGRACSAVWVSTLVQWLWPGSQFLLRWMALFFVPPLVLLPLAEPPSSRSLAVLIPLLLGGFCVTLLLTATFARLVTPSNPAVQTNAPGSVHTWSLKTVFSFWLGLALLAFPFALTLAPGPLGTAAEVGFGVALSVVCFIAAEWVRSGLGKLGVPLLTAIIHPVLLCAAAIAVVWVATGRTLEMYLKPLSEHPTPGSALAFLLRPAVVALALQLDAQRQLIRVHLLPLLLTTAASAFSSLFLTALVGGLVGLEELYARALIARSVTTPVALAIAEALNANGGLTAVFVILTGVLGALFAQPLLQRCGFRSPFVVGVATGAASHGIGTAALAKEDPVAAAFSGIAFALTAVISVLLASIDSLRSLWLALLH